MTHIVDVFKCCILTWDFLPVVLPAFLIAGAIPVFVPTGAVLKYLGHGASRVTAYLTASFSGFALSMCSCNIVPVAASIRRRGAGIGPAYAFLYAGPAINLVTMVWVFQVVGLKMGLWRAAAVPLIAIATGITMQFLFRGEDLARRVELESAAQAEVTFAADEAPANPRHVALLFGLMMAILLLGTRGLPWFIKLPAVTVVGGVLAFQLTVWFRIDQLREWMEETWRYLKVVLPILIPAILIIGYLQNNKATWNWLYSHLYPLMGENQPKHCFAAAVFGSVMYFPVLTEVALTKALLKEEMIGVGPALAILLNGPGVSLPGAILLVKLFGWKKTLVYEGLEIFFGGVAASVFGHYYGAYHCPCQSGELKSIAEDPSALIAALILGLCIVIAWQRGRAAARRAELLDDGLETETRFRE
jgi:hypothetical protein